MLPFICVYLASQQGWGVICPEGLDCVLSNLPANQNWLWGVVSCKSSSKLLIPASVRRMFIRGTPASDACRPRAPRTSAEETAVERARGGSRAPSRRGAPRGAPPVAASVRGSAWRLGVVYTGAEDAENQHKVGKFLLGQAAGVPTCSSIIRIRVTLSIVTVLVQSGGINRL